MCGQQPAEHQHAPHSRDPRLQSERGHPCERSGGKQNKRTVPPGACHGFVCTAAAGGPRLRQRALLVGPEGPAGRGPMDTSEPPPFDPYPRLSPVLLSIRRYWNDEVRR